MKEFDIKYKLVLPTDESNNTAALFANGEMSPCPEKTRLAVQNMEVEGGIIKPGVEQRQRVVTSVKTEPCLSSCPKFGTYNSGKLHHHCQINRVIKIDEVKRAEAPKEEEKQDGSISSLRKT